MNEGINFPMLVQITRLFLGEIKNHVKSEALGALAELLPRSLKDHKAKSPPEFTEGLFAFNTVVRS
jgi:hypothetical protein